MTMKLLLDNLFFLGEVISLAGLAWGAGLVLRESLAGSVFPHRKSSGLVTSLAECLLHPIRCLARI
jgi:hypothetical protein